MPRPRLCETHCSVPPTLPCGATVFIIQSTRLAPLPYPALTALPVLQRARRTTKGFGEITCWPPTSTCIWAVSRRWRSTLSTSAGVSARHETLTHPHVGIKCQAEGSFRGVQSLPEKEGTTWGRREFSILPW